MTEPDSEALFEQVRDTSSEALTESIEEVEHLGEEALEGAKRAHVRDLNQNWVKVKKCGHWAFGVAGLILMVVAVVVLVELLYVYISDVIKDVGSVKELLSILWNTVLIALATLFVDRSTNK